MSDRETFGPRLRSERERRGISLETIASVTKVGAELWEGLERNDFSRWPTGIFARAFVRDYALAVGLDADEVIDEFCRLFPIGDRRAERLIKAHGELIGHSVASTPSMVPPTGDRRAAGRQKAEQARARRIRLAPRTVAAGVDTVNALVAGDRRVGAAQHRLLDDRRRRRARPTTACRRSRSARRQERAPSTPSASGCRRCSPSRTVAARTPKYNVQACKATAGNGNVFRCTCHLLRGALRLVTSVSNHTEARMRLQSPFVLFPPHN